jgi:SGNH domain (fused to AT3 domains)
MLAKTSMERRAGAFRPEHSSWLQSLDMPGTRARFVSLIAAIAALLALAPVTVTATAVPTNVKPSVADASTDIEGISTNGCRVPKARITVRTDCIYGDTAGTKKIALVGDSHAATLFPPLNALAKQKHWKLNVQTKISCRFVDLPLIYLGSRYTECEQWRLNVIAYLKAHPQDLVIFVVARRMTPLPSRPGDDDPTVQGHALARLMGQIPGKHVVIVDTPFAYYDVPKCLAKHMNNYEACATLRTQAFDGARNRVLEETAVADDSNATLVDLSNNICPVANYCQPVLNGYIVMRDNLHMTRTFAKTLQGALGSKLPPI